MEDDTETREPPESLLPYDQWTEEALHGVVSRALANTAAHGLPGAHHFYITFRTDFPGVVIPPRLRAKYPEEMTIVLQHQYENLHVDQEAGLFGVSLSFGGMLSPLTVPLAAVTAFVDPHVQFGLRFRVAKPEALPAPPEKPAAAIAPPDVPSEQPQVVSLDAFRRKRD